MKEMTQQHFDDLEYFVKYKKNKCMGEVWTSENINTLLVRGYQADNYDDIERYLLRVFVYDEIFVHHSTVVNSLTKLRADKIRVIFTAKSDRVKKKRLLKFCNGIMNTMYGWMMLFDAQKDFIKGILEEV